MKPRRNQRPGFVQRAILEAMEDGRRYQVRHLNEAMHEMHGWSVPDAGKSMGITLRRMERAGWVECVGVEPTRWGPANVWRRTKAGREVIDG